MADAENPVVLPSGEDEERVENPVVNDGAVAEHATSEELHGDTEPVLSDNAHHAQVNESHADDQVVPNNESNADGDADAPGNPDVSSVSAEHKADSDEVKGATAQNGTAKPGVKVVRKPTDTSKVPSGKTVTTAPSVKKIVSSGTYGTGSVKPSPPASSKASGITSSATTKPAASALRKSTSAPPPKSITASTASGTAKPTSKPTTAATAKAPPIMSSKSGTSTALSQSTATRRPSLPPKPPLSSSTSRLSRNSPDSARSGVTSPSGTNTTVRTTTTTRPRAQVSDGLPARRQSIGPKPGVPSTASKPPISGAIRRPTGANSISSLKDIKEDSAATEVLQKKFADTEASLKEQALQITKTQEQLKSTQDELTSVRTELDTKDLAISDLEKEKAAAEEQLSALISSAEEIKSKLDIATKAHEALQNQLSDAQSQSSSHASDVQQLQDALKAAQEDVERARRDIEELRSATDASASTSAAAAAVEHKALLKAQADLDSIQSEMNGLNDAHAAALTEAQAKIAELVAASSNAEERFNVEIATATKEKEELISRLSELEVEVLELKEASEVNEEKVAEYIARVQNLEGELENAIAATEKALEDAKAREVEHAQALSDLNGLHDEALKAAQTEKDALDAKLTDMDASLSTSQARHEQALADIQAAEAAHAQKLANAEQAHAARLSELSAEMERLSTDLAGQEAQYAAKVDDIKAEHDNLLQEAFEHAKTEAGDAHSQELQNLRKQSQETIEQLRAQHLSYVEDMKAEHVSAMETRVKAMEKEANERSLDLKATQDDLVKAKASVAASVHEIESLKKQVEEAESLVASVTESSASEHVAELKQLRMALQDAQDEVSNLNSVITAQKDSIGAMNVNHEKEREEAAHAHIEETSKLRSDQESERSTFQKERDELTIRVADLEGEIVTLRAAAAAASSTVTSSPKSNGAARMGTPDISREELQRLHDAHNMKMIDLEAQHTRVVRSLSDERDNVSARSAELNDALERKDFENNLLQQDNDDKEDMISRLKEDLASLTERLVRYETGEVPTK